MVSKEDVLKKFFALMVDAYPKHQGNRRKSVAEVRKQLIKDFGEENVPAAKTLENKHRVGQPVEKGPLAASRAPSAVAANSARTPAYGGNQAVLRDSMRNLDTSVFYTSLTEERPLALLISNYEFEGNEQERAKHYRHGSQEKNWRLKSHLGYLGYDVIYRENLKAEEMLKELEAFYNDSRHKKACRAVVYISTHGEENVSFGVDFLPVYIDDIRISYGAVDDLKNKLKLLILSSCRNFTQKKKPIKISESCAKNDARTHYDVWCIYTTTENHTSLRSTDVVLNSVL